jgi:caa(3)-type oxidase subunit IV
MRALVLTILVLLGLTAVSFLIAKVELGPLSTPVALAIATVKAVVVGWWFMELPHASLPARVVALVTVAFIALLCAGTVADIALR